MWITVYQCGSKCYKISSKWEKVELKNSYDKPHGHMRIIQKVSKVFTSFGTFEIKVTQVKGLKARKMVPVKNKKK